MKRYQVSMIITINLITKWKEEELRHDLGIMITNAINKELSFDVAIEKISMEELK